MIRSFKRDYVKFLLDFLKPSPLWDKLTDNHCNFEPYLKLMLFVMEIGNFMKSFIAFKFEFTLVS